MIILNNYLKCIDFDLTEITNLMNTIQLEIN